MQSGDLTRRLVFGAAAIRSAVTGFVGVGLGLYLAEAGLDERTLGLVVGLGLAGNAAGTALVAWAGDRSNLGRLLLLTSVLSASGLVLAAALPSPGFLGLAAFVGMLNGMGRDRGAAQAMEQSLLADPETVSARTAAFVRYSAIQDIAGAVGSLGAAIPAVLVASGLGGLHSWQLTFLLAGLLTLATTAMYLCLPAGASRVANAPPAGVSRESKRRIAGLAGLFSLDSLGGGFLASSILSYWFFRRFGFTGAELGPLFLAGRMLNVGSYAAAERLAGRIGLLRTMVYTHLPSSVILLCLPLVGTPWQAIVIFLLRESLVQMDVPTRQSYVALVTRPGERTLAMGVTNLTRNVGWALGPSAGGAAMATFGLGAPLVIGASLKIAYDLLLFAAYRRVPEEGQRDRGTD